MSLPPPKSKPRYIPGKTCGRCFAPVLWGIDEEGRRIALDAQGELRFVLALRPDSQLPTVVQEQCYVRHRATCPKAKAKRPLKSRSTGCATETHAPNREPRKAPKPRPS
jgi:hypothetical protein